MISTQHPWRKTVSHHPKLGVPINLLFLSENDIVEDVGVLCNSEDITLTLRVSTDYFNGMIYPKGLSKNSTCMTEYIQQEGIITYTLPLRSCNTMSTDVQEGMEYFNTVVIQPHRKLVTNQGRGYHVRCRYQSQEKTLTNDFNVRWGNSVDTRILLRTVFVFFCLANLSHDIEMIKLDNMQIYSSLFKFSLWASCEG